MVPFSFYNYAELIKRYYVVYTSATVYYTEDFVTWYDSQSVYGQIVATYGIDAVSSIPATTLGGYEAKNAADFLKYPTIASANGAGGGVNGNTILSVGSYASTAYMSFDGGSSWSSYSFSGGGENAGLPLTSFLGNLYYLEVDAGAGTTPFMHMFNGTSWTSQTFPNPGSLGSNPSGMATNGTTLVVTGTNSTGNMKWTTTDGVNWSTSANSIAVNDLAYGNGTYVAVGNAGAVWTSPDATTWTARTSGVATTNTKIQFFDGAFHVSSQNNILISTDGITWTVRTVPDSAIARKIQPKLPYNTENSAPVLIAGATLPQNNPWQFSASLNSSSRVIVAVAPTGTNRVMRSFDYGATWSVATASQANSWRSIANNGSTWVAVSSDGTNRVMTSTNNGGSWTNRTAAQANYWRSVAYGNGVFVAVSSNGTNRCMTSADGITWTARTIPSLFFTSVAYGNGIFLAVADGQSNFYTSTDGITWTARAHGQGTESWSDVKFSEGMFIITAIYSPLAPLLRNITTTTNGTTYTTHPYVSEDKATYMCCYKVRDVYLLLGDSLVGQGIPYNKTALYSYDLTNWYEVQSGGAIVGSICLNGLVLAHNTSGTTLYRFRRFKAKP